MFGLHSGLADDVMSAQDIVMTVAMVLAAVGTWLVPNTPALAAAKLWVSALVIGAGVLAPLIAGGVTTQEGIDVMIAVLTAAGVYVAPNKTQFGLAA